MIERRAYTSGHFELDLDGEKATSYLKMVDGGFMNHSLVDEAIGGENRRIKHAAVADVEAISFEIGMAGASGILKWLQSSLDKRFETRSGQITHANFDLDQVFEHEFSDALLTEATFPTLDGGSKESAYLKVKLQPATVATRKAPGPKLKPVGGTKQKQWLCSAFRLHIDGLDDLKYANKIESFTIKQNVKKLYTGPFRQFELSPTKIEFPNLVGTISLDKADGLLAWYETYIVKGKKDPRAQRTGSLEFLSPDRRETLLHIDLLGVGILKANLLQSTANSDQIKRVKFELYVTEMKIDSGRSRGLD